MAGDDRSLVRALRGQERGAFDDLYARYHSRIWAFLVRLAGSAEAPDLFQDTWVSAARHAHRLAEDTNPLPWLYTIARNKHRNARRFLVFDFKKKVRVAVEPSPSPLAPDEVALLRAELARVWAAFDKLSDAHREVLLLCGVEGLDARQAGGVLGLKEEAVRKRLSRARLELARVVQAGDPERAIQEEAEA